MESVFVNSKETTCAVKPETDTDMGTTVIVGVTQVETDVEVSVRSTRAHEVDQSLP